MTWGRETEKRLWDGVCGFKGLGKGVSCEGRVPVTCGVRWSSYRLSSHVLLAFWAFAGVVMVTGHRPPTRAPPRWRRRRGRLGGGEGGRGVRGAALAQTPPLRWLPPPPSARRRAAPHPAPAVRAPVAAAPLPGPGLPAPNPSVRSRGSDSSSRRRRRHGPGAGALRHFRLSLHYTPHTRQQRRHRHSGLGWDATWAPRHPARGTRPLRI